MENENLHNNITLFFICYKLFVLTIKKSGSLHSNENVICEEFFRIFQIQIQ